MSLREINFIFMQIFFIVLLLQHGRCEHTLYMFWCCLFIACSRARLVRFCRVPVFRGGPVFQILELVRFCMFRSLLVFLCSRFLPGAHEAPELVHFGAYARCKTHQLRHNLQTNIGSVTNNAKNGKQENK